MKLPPAKRLILIACVSLAIAVLTLLLAGCGFIGPDQFECMLVLPTAAANFVATAVLLGAAWYLSTASTRTAAVVSAMVASVAAFIVSHNFTHAIGPYAHGDTWHISPLVVFPVAAAICVAYALLHARRHRDFSPVAEGVLSILLAAVVVVALSDMRLRGFHAGESSAIEIVKCKVRDTEPWTYVPTREMNPHLTIELCESVQTTHLQTTCFQALAIATSRPDLCPPFLNDECVRRTALLREKGADCSSADSSNIQTGVRVL